VFEDSQQMRDSKAKVEASWPTCLGRWKPRSGSQRRWFERTTFLTVFTSVLISTSPLLWKNRGIQMLCESRKQRTIVSRRRVFSGKRWFHCLKRSMRRCSSLTCFSMNMNLPEIWERGTFACGCHMD